MGRTLKRRRGRVQGSEGCGGRRARGPNTSRDRGLAARHSHPKVTLSGRPTQDRSAGGSLFCPRSAELAPTRPVPPGEAAGRRVSRGGQDRTASPRPPAAQEGPEAWGARGGGGQPGNLTAGHRLEEDRAFSPCCAKMNRTRDAPARFSNQERRGLRGRPCSRTDICSGRPRAAEEPRNGWRAPHFPGWGDTGP